MKLSEKQFLMLIRLLHDTINYPDAEGCWFLDHGERLELYKQLINQQSEELCENEDICRKYQDLMNKVIIGMPIQDCEKCKPCKSKEGIFCKVCWKKINEK